MSRRRRSAPLLAALLAILVFYACSPDMVRETNTADLPPPPERLMWFGFVGVACGDDLSAEVAGFTNVATTCGPDPGVASIVARQLDTFEGRGLRALLNVEGVFFERDGSAPAAPSGNPPLVLREDFAARWTRFVAGADLLGRRDQLAAVFVADEPTWQGVRTDELTIAYDTVRATLPEVALLLIEAYPVLDDLVIPETVDLVAFDRYGVLDPENDAAYLRDLTTLKARRSRPDQRILLVMEAQWLPDYGALGVPPEAMADVAMSYYRLAATEGAVIGIIGYLWPSGRDAPGQVGARDLPSEVQLLYRRMGEGIIGAAR